MESGHLEQESQNLSLEDGLQPSKHPQQTPLHGLTPSEVLETAQNTSNIPTISSISRTETHPAPSPAPPTQSDLHREAGPDSDVPTGEVRLEATLRMHDEQKIARCNGDIDTLLVFAGLFSAVLATFNIQSYQILQPDPTAAYTLLLTQIAHQVLSANLTQGSLLSPNPSPLQTPSFAVRVNALWFASLICSLVTASLAMLVKQWFREYLNWDCTASDERIRIRHVRYSGLIRWRIFETAAMLPLLLQASLVLFFLGLSEWIRAVNWTVWLIVTSLILPWLFLYAITISAPVFSSNCPYKTPFLNHWIQSGRAIFLRLRYGRQWRTKLGYRNPYNRFPGDGRGVRRDLTLDIPALISADRTLRDDNILSTSIRTCLQNVEGAKVIRITCKLFEHRLGRPVTHLHGIEFGRIPSMALNSIVHILSDALERETHKTQEAWVSWMREATNCLSVLLRHAQAHDRNIDTARSSVALASLLSLDPACLPEFLVIFTVGVPIVNWDIAGSRQEQPLTSVVSNVTHTTRKLLMSITQHHDPLRLAGEFLLVMEVMDFDSLMRNYLQFNQVTIELSVAIWARGLTFGLNPVVFGSHCIPRYAKLLLSACRRLNRRVHGIVGDDMVFILSQIHKDGKVSFNSWHTQSPSDHPPISGLASPHPHSQYNSLDVSATSPSRDTVRRLFGDESGSIVGSDIQIFGRPSHRTGTFMFDWRSPTPLLIQSTTNFITDHHSVNSPWSFMQDFEADSISVVSHASSSLSRAPLPLYNETVPGPSPVDPTSPQTSSPTHTLSSALGRILMVPRLLPLRTRTLGSQDSGSPGVPSVHQSSDLVRSPLSRLAFMSTPALLPSHRESYIDGPKPSAV